MSKVVGEIVIDVLADVGQMVREFARGEARMGAFGQAAQAVGSRMQSVGAASIALGQRMAVITAAAAAAGGALIAMTNRIAASADRIGENARAVGMSAEAYQEYAFAIGEVADVSEDEFAKAMQVMTRRLGEAQQGSAQAIAAFEAIGISAADIAAGTIDSERALGALVERIESTTDPAVAAAIATDLMGRTGARMGSLLAGTSGDVERLRQEAQRLGVVMDGDAVEAAGRYQDQVGRLAAAFAAAQLAVAQVFMPILADALIPFLINTAIPAMVSIAQSVGHLITWFQGLPQPVQAAAGALAVAFAVGGPALVAIGKASQIIGAFVAATGPIGLLIAGAGAIIAAWQVWGDDIIAAVKPGIDWLTEKFTAFLGVIDRIVGGAAEMTRKLGEAVGYAPAGEGGFEPDYMGQTPMNQSFNDAMSGAGMGASVADGLVNGLVGQITAREEEIRAAINRVPEIAREELGIQSPSRVFAQIGGFIGEGMAQGIADSTAVVAAAVRGMGQGAVGEAQGTVAGVLDAMGVLFEGSRKVGAGLAMVSTMIGAAKELERGVFGIATAQRVIAQGTAFMRAIRSARPGGASAAGGAGGGAAAAPEVPVQRVMVEWNGPQAAMPGMQALFDTLNQAGRMGYRLDARLVAAGGV